jgi:D-alanyl-D-alanine carboxypeptidase/D-alanyl-D-alanine-endopeptidase (penicillin-binding protein 4)
MKSIRGVFLPRLRAGRVGASLLALAIVASPESVLAGSLAAGIAGQVDRARQVAREIGVHVVDAEKLQTVFEYGADRSLIVASNTKLVTSAAALDELGPGFQFETPVLVRGALVGDRLYGDLAVVGSGDPTISGRFFGDDPLAPFRDWAARLGRLGIRRVHGTVYLAHGLFDEELVHPDWPRNQLARWYEAPVGALSFNDNCVLVRITPAADGGSKPMVQVVPDLGQMIVENAAVTTTSRRRHLVVVDRPPGSDRILVSGRILRDAAPVEAWVSVGDPVEYFGRALNQALEVEGIHVGGGWSAVERVPSGQWRVAFEHRSDLLTTIEVINRRSQNFFAESVLKTLGARRCRDGSWEAGLEVVRQFLDRAGVPSGYTMVDGSGMSRNNRFSARQLTALLGHMARHQWNEEYVQSLPYSGLEDHPGWRKRLSDEPYRGRVYAKTGSLRGVSTLSGYARGMSGRTYMFSILLNRVDSIWAGRRVQDRILRELIDKG